MSGVLCMTYVGGVDANSKPLVFSSTTRHGPGVTKGAAVQPNDWVGIVVPGGNGMRCNHMRGRETFGCFLVFNSIC
jgi:hypothetical protein